MKKNKWIKKLLVILLISFIMIAVTGETYAAINEKYFEALGGSMEVVDSSLNAKMENNILLNVLGNLIYGLGSLFEWILGKLFEMLTGSNMFPWADAILFNAVPFLDINIFNPSAASFVALLRSFLSNTYYTIFSLALTFFGIAVMITAIKLAISAIAEDKAKYKKAIVSWLLGLVMLVGIHYFISFVLYLNEQLVEMASQMAMEAMKDAKFSIAELYDESMADTEIITNFLKAMRSNKINLGKTIALIILAIAVVIIAAILIYFTGGSILGIIQAGGLAALKGITVAGIAKGTLVLGVGTIAKGIALASVATIAATAAGGYLIVATTSGSIHLLQAYTTAIFDEDNGGWMTAAKAMDILSDSSSAGYTASLLGNENYVGYLEYTIGKTLKSSEEDGFATMEKADGINTMKYVALDVAQMMQVDSTDGDEYIFKICPNGKAKCKDHEAYNYYTTTDEYGNLIESGLLTYPEYLESMVAPMNKWKEASIGYYQHLWDTAPSTLTFANFSDENSQGYNKLYVKKAKNDLLKRETECYVVEPEVSGKTVTGIKTLSTSTKCKDNMMIVYDEIEMWHIESVLGTYKEIHGLSNLSESSLLTNLAKIFKSLSWTTANGGWKPNKVVVQNALLYAILVVQSLIFFIAYTKRLFYVIILIVMAPIVVVFDFFTKFGA